MINRIDVKEFFNIRKNNIPVIDVRSPGEYSHGHIPYSYNVILFDDEERKNIGIIYHENGREEAVLNGLKYVAPKMIDLIIEINCVCKKYFNGEKKILMHCARGGMRSESLAWLCSIYGYEVYILEGGYKSYRHYVLNIFERKYKICLLSGRTGSGKTVILKELKGLNEETIDLEAIANHKGSAFGGIGEDVQPTQEQFENNLAFCLDKIDIDSILWLEDESFLIGKCALPKALFNQMKDPYKIVYIDLPKEARANHIVEYYGKYDKISLKESIMKIKKRLGLVRMNEALSLLEKNRVYECVLTLLYYYDKAYRLNVKENIYNVIKIKSDFMDAQKISELILKSIN